MTTYNTGNPIGSKDPRDLYDDAENLDEAVNTRSAESWNDRFGVARKTWWGMEQDFQRFLINSGYQNIGDYGPGLEITARNQIFWRDGELYRASAALSLPYTATGIWADEESLFVAVGDQSLRQSLLGSYGAGFAHNSVINNEDIASLIGTPSEYRRSDVGYIVSSYHLNSENPSGGGVFYWYENEPKSLHDGGTVIDPDHPDVPFSPEWYTETGSGVGVFKRVFDDEIFIEDFGASEGVDVTLELQAAINAAERLDVWVKALPDRSYAVSSTISAGQAKIDFNNSTLTTTAPAETIVIGNISSERLATSLTQAYAPFSGQIRVFLNSVANIEVGDVISIIGNDTFHPNREAVYKRGVTSIVAAVGSNFVYIQDEIPFNLSVSGSRVIVLKPSRSVIRNIKFVGDVNNPGNTLSALVVVGQVNPLIENVFTDGFGNCGVKAYHSVGVRIKNITTGRSYYDGTDTSYGLSIYSCTRVHISRLVTHTGRHGFVTGSNSSYLPGVAIGDDRGAPVFGLLIDGESSIFPEIGTVPAAQGGHNGLDCHEGTYDVTVRDSRFYKFQLGANFITFDNCRIFGNAGTNSLLYFIPESSEGAFLFKDTVFEGNGRIGFKGYLPHGGSGTYTGVMHIPSLVFENCRALSPIMIVRPLLILGGNECIIRSLILDGTHGIAVREHDLSAVEIQHIQFRNIKDRRRAHYTYTGSGSRVGIFEVNDCVWVGGFQALILDSALVANVNNLVFDGNDGSFTASIADDSRIYLNNSPLTLGSGSNGVNVVSRGGGGIIRRVASPIILNSSSTLGNFTINEQVISN